MTRADNTVAAINRLFVTSLVALAQSGKAEHACRLAAEGWSALRHDHPREAERLNAAMHGLARNLSIASSNNTGDANG